MCGFVGTASTEPQTYRSWLSDGSGRLHHRGPDDRGEWWSEDGRIGLAHRRLSILDLSPLGRQPMHNKQHGLSIVFNGEIYNFVELRDELQKLGHVFCSKNDTEVLLASYIEWGSDFLDRLNGMFAFALYDSLQQMILLARDRAGEKPLFYYIQGSKLFFASELKALLAHPKLPRQVNTTALDCYLAMGYVPGDLCMLKGYHKLSAAHAMSFDLHSGDLQNWRYWQLPNLNKEAGSRDESSLLEELESLLNDAVGRQMVADVPVGILLSGGIDSSLITALAVRHSQKVQTFSIGFPGHGKLDETDHARLIAQYFGTQHTELMAEPATADLIPVLAQQFDEPMVDSSMIPTYLVSQLVRQHCTVALGGDGGDELFGGYTHYSHLLWMQERLAKLPGYLDATLAMLAEQVVPVGFKGRNYLQSLRVNLKQELPLIAYVFDTKLRRKLLANVESWSASAEQIRQESVPLQSDLLQRATRMDFQSYLTEDILVKVDRASMHHSLEMRAPFLDHRVIEFAFRCVPSHLKATSSSKKILLKQLTKKLLPPEFDRQRKQGFSIPLNHWLKKGPFRELFWDVLTQIDCSFERKMVQKLLRLQDLGMNNGERLFALVQFELWRRTYGVSI